MGQKEILELLTEVISWNKSGMLLSYDTTFCLGEFYVSPLLFRYWSSRKIQLFQQCSFFMKGSTRVFTNCSSQYLRNKSKAGLPIVVDMEPGIVGKTSLHLAGCWRHMKKDVSRKLIADGVPQSQRVKIINDLYVLLRSKSQREYNEHLNRCTNEWSPALKIPSWTM